MLDHGGPSVRSPIENGTPSDSSGGKSLRRIGSGQNPLQWLYSPVESWLVEVEDQLRLEFDSRIPELATVVQHGTQLGGKRLRPALVLLAASASGCVSRPHVILATVIEMVHTATLVHDDVIDRAERRRRVPTVNAKWNRDVSLLLGDYLFSQAFRLAATLPTIEACEQIGEASRRVCEGELRQVLNRNILDLEESTYIEIVRGKTAELCRVACQLGARYSEADSATVEALASYGENLGIAFQIADDYLDLWGDDDRVGKTLATDIVQGKMTLPLIRLLKQSPEDDRRRIIEILRGPSAERLSRIRPFLESSEAASDTQRMAECYRDRAIAALQCLPPTLSKDSLVAIARFSVDRHW